MKLKRKPKWVVLDVGKVLLDWKPSMTAIGSKLGISGESFHSFLIDQLDDLERGAIEPIDFWSIVTNKFPTDSTSKELDQLWVTSHTPIKEIWALIEELRYAKYNLAVCTNNWKGMVDRYKEFFLGYPNFGVVVDSSVEKVRKPETEIYKIVERKTESQKEDLFFIDDIKKNIEGAKVLGWQTYLFESKDDNGKSSCDELRALLL